jgi:DNA-binding NarL/FixJ family response regulator
MPSPSSSIALDALRVLLVDESDRVRNTLVTVMRTFGRYEVVAQASDLLESLRAAVRVDPDVVIFDFDLPRHNEADAILAMRVLLPDSLIVVVAGDPSPSAEQLVLAAGADACVDKADTIRLPELLDELLDELFEGAEHPPTVL